MYWDILEFEQQMLPLIKSGNYEDENLKFQFIDLNINISSRKENYLIANLYKNVISDLHQTGKSDLAIEIGNEAFSFLNENGAFDYYYASFLFMINSPLALKYLLFSVNALKNDKIITENGKLELLKQAYYLIGTIYLKNNQFYLAQKYFLEIKNIFPDFNSIDNILFSINSKISYNDTIEEENYEISVTLQRLKLINKYSEYMLKNHKPDNIENVLNKGKRTVFLLDEKDFDEKDGLYYFFINTKILMILKRYNQALKLVIEGLDLYKNSPYMLSLGCELYFEMKNKNSCRNCCLSFFQELENQDFISMENYPINEIKENIKKIMTLNDEF